MNNLLSNNKQLQREVVAIYSDSGIVECLEKFGKPQVVGSAKYGLMTWRDLDFNLVTKEIPDDISFWKIVKKLFNLKRVKSITIADNRNGNEGSNRPKSMYVGLKYQISDKTPIWKLDIRFLRKEDVVTRKVDVLVNEKLTDKNKLTILDIKSQVCNNPDYHKKFSSVDIYESVLNENVSNFEEFDDYLKKMNQR